MALGAVGGALESLPEPPLLPATPPPPFACNIWPAALAGFVDRGRAKSEMLPL